MTRAVSAEALIAELGAALPEQGAAALAFDGDGTLWWGDVSEDVLSFANAEGLLREEARPALVEAAEAHGVSSEGSASALAARIFEAYLDRRYPEREVCEMMTWCYAGYSLAELGPLVREAFARRDLDERVNTSLSPVIQWARGHGLRTVIVSASPHFIVEQAARLWGIGASDIAASRAVLDGDRLAPRMHGEVPYAEHKPLAGRALIGDAAWLASFGDSAFDIEMLRAARIGVAVRPRADLVDHMHAHPELLLFE